MEFHVSTILKDSKYKVVANIPYYLTSYLIRDIFEKWPQPELIVLTIQKEVAQRMMAKPPHMNLLALSVQYYAKPEIVKIISKNNFRPVPKIDSAIIRLAPRKEKINHEQAESLFKLIKTGFSEKRKQLASNLSAKSQLPKEIIVENLLKLGLTPTVRAENLTLGQWKDLNNSLGI